MTRGIRTITIGLGFATALTSVAMAGGFSRGTADTDILYEEGGVVTRMGVSYVMPQRGYDSITSPFLNGGLAFSPTDDDYSDAYAVPSFAGKFDLTDDFRCAGTMTDAYGAGASYGPQAIAAGMADGTGTESQKFTSTEIGATCGFKFDLAKGRAWIIGGVFGEDFKFSQTVRLLSDANLDGAPGGPHPFGVLDLGGPVDGANSGTLSFDGRYELGYRIGLAYEIPEIALRAQLLYRSAVKHNPSGSFDFVDFNGADLASYSTMGYGTLPQSLELKVQSGIAPGWLAFGSVKWTDWSVVQTLDYTIDTSATVLGTAIPTELEYFWQDGWTVSGGVGHAFNDMVSGSMSLTWDKGVSTTEDVFTDTWTLGGGLAIAANSNTKLSVGGAISYLTAGSVAAEAVPGGGGPGDTFAYSVGNDWSYAVGGNLLINF